MKIPEKRVQCRFCGRIRMNGAWRRIDVIADATGQCPTCIEWVKKVNEKKRRDENRRLRRGEFELPKLADPFDAISHDAERK